MDKNIRNVLRNLNEKVDKSLIKKLKKEARRKAEELYESGEYKEFEGRFSYEGLNRLEILGMLRNRLLYCFVMWVMSYKSTYSNDTFRRFLDMQHPVDFKQVNIEEKVRKRLDEVATEISVREDYEEDEIMDIQKKLVDGGIKLMNNLDIYLEVSGIV